MTTEVAPVVRQLTQQRIDAYADASGDHNPIHVDPVFAGATQFGGTIAHGMLVLALIGDMMRASFGDTWSAAGKIKIRFKAPTRPGDTVTASAIFAKHLDGAFEYAVQCATQSGEVVIEGRAIVAVPT